MKDKIYLRKVVERNHGIAAYAKTIGIHNLRDIYWRPGDFQTISGQYWYDVHFYKVIAVEDKDGTASPYGAEITPSKSGTMPFSALEDDYKEGVLVFHNPIWNSSR
jgi:hypothetical protein